MNAMAQIASRKEKGFTLIELVMVIVILGILAAFALPRFADLGSDARTASIQGARGAVNAAVSIARAGYLANGKSSPVSLDGADIEMSANGYPIIVPTGADGGIEDAAQLSSEYDISAPASNVTTIALKDSDGNPVATCSFTYNELTGAVSAAATGGC